MPPSPRYRRAAGWAWRWWNGSVLALATGHDAVQLSGASAAIWDALERPATVEELVVRSGGAASRALVEGAVADLVAIGMVDASVTDAEAR